jgi:hypothetical protein
MKSNGASHHNDNENGEYSPEFDFHHHLYDTILLLGGRKQIADLVKKAMDCAVTDSDIDALRRYNTELITLAKDRLANLNSITLRPAPQR